LYCNALLYVADGGDALRATKVAPM